MGKPQKLLITAGTLAGLCLLGFIGARIGVAVVSGPPDNLGHKNGRLAPCPDTPNCVSSQAADAGHSIEPLAFSGSADDARARLLAALNTVPRLTVVTDDGNYIHAEARSLMWGFVDDNEFYIDEAAGVIHVRAAARLGVSDLGKNRQRIEAIRAAF
ncbi:MAG: DUF1499 domain-containing protein [Chloroflexi bacterium]|nr:MAG: DUF1499 domain-containing protein [Chloroflexota bacterium]